MTAENAIELKILVIKVKEYSAKMGLQLNTEKTKLMGGGREKPIIFKLIIILSIKMGSLSIQDCSGVTLQGTWWVRLKQALGETIAKLKVSRLQEKADMSYQRSKLISC